MKTLLIALLIFPSICFAEKIVGYEYYTPKAETAVVSDMSVMSGTKSSTERYEKIARKDISTTLDNYAKTGKVKKAIVIETYDYDKNGKVIAIITRKEGTIPADLNYSTAEENKKKIEIEKARLKAIQEQKLEDEAKANLGL